MRILIVEDEEVAARGLKKMLLEILEKEIQSIQIEKSLIGSTSFMQEKEIDLVFLDLDLNGENGFDLLKLSISSSFQTIIVSANIDKAILAFEYGVLDFVAKPIQVDRLKKAINKLKSDSFKPKTKYLGVKEEDSIQFLLTKNILYIQGNNNNSILHLKDGSKKNHSKNLENISKIIPSYFFRIHKSYLINLKELEKILVQSGGNYKAKLNTGKLIPISRKIFPLLKKRINF
jgi:DNA-binding LytR/AlgR family response regulator